MSVGDSMGEEEGWAEMAGRIRDYLIGAAKKDRGMSLATDSGDRVPGILKKERGWARGREGRRMFMIAGRSGSRGASRDIV